MNPISLEKSKWQCLKPFAPSEFNGDRAKGKAFLTQGGTGTKKKDQASIFFVRPTSKGLSTYVVRHHSQYGNMMSSPHLLSTSASA
jgi:hypothetical protein